MNTAVGLLVTSISEACWVMLLVEYIELNDKQSPE